MQKLPLFSCISIRNEGENRQIAGEPDQFGARTGCPTSYPSGIAEGATFNKSLWLAVGAADGREGRALHNQVRHERHALAHV